MCVRVFWSAQALHGETNALYWKCIKRQNSTHLTLLKHQNTKTSLYKLFKNHWVITLLEILGSVRRKLQSTVSLDHPVLIIFNFRLHHHRRPITVSMVVVSFRCFKDMIAIRKVFDQRGLKVVHIFSRGCRLLRDL